ncbi:MAG TPA: SDR family NAD(P)-dependent oxidoreductase [Bacteroidales bacterium]|nr:SDR family NAD(P)-dependent oxidoreductase [Bacteroidales bacterium]HCI55918.1 NAD(P)-dependent oxidoreductase [Bacteroidales bacterium]HOU95761.1 SDR family NAD(P)-dependent oxidoreductase [Bacteroidales bacterium]HQG37288.1 SDR family NAD(P)-dependent oxidoreductase [Bacteroidales bacterium]HQG52851.1 SDR family NAD(P)-dependent oxidoreductase [Bacteroidales bacterium]
MNKIIMITGASSGFGRATARKFAMNEYNVIITGRRTERLEEVEQELNSLNAGIKVLSLNFDVRKRYEVEDIIEEMPDEWKKIDILVNNAGLAVGLDTIDKGNIDDWDRMVDTNIKGILYVTRAVAPLMVERKSGHIFNISSIAGKQEYEKGNVYCATKHAVDSLSRSMRIDLLRHNIKVTNVAPGMAETEFSLVRFKGDKKRAKEVYEGIKPLTAEDIAEVIFWCASLPPHVCINDITITPTQQANVYYVNKEVKVD